MGPSARSTSFPRCPCSGCPRRLGITSPKYGCGVAQCGACTVQIDGKAVRSCQSRIGEIAGKSVVTIEGLDNREQHRFCRPGSSTRFRSAATARPARSCRPSRFLNMIPKPTDEDINEVMSGNLCRCGTYPRIRAAIHAAAAKMVGK